MVIIVLLVLPSIIPNMFVEPAHASLLNNTNLSEILQSNLEDVLKDSSSNESGIVRKIIEFLLLAPMRLNRMFFLRFEEPQTFLAEPNVIDIKYLDQTEITIGAINITSGEFILLNDPMYIDPLFPSQDYEFSLEIPEYLPDDAFVAHFQPQRLAAGPDEEGEVKTKLLITSNIPRNIALPENIHLRVNITKYMTAGNLYLPRASGDGILGGKILDRIPIIGLLKAGNLPIFWIISACTPLFQPPFGILYSGKRLPDPPMYLDLIVKLNRYHLAEITPPGPYINMKPDELQTISIKIKNLGSHIDCFNFRIASNSGSELIISPPSAITLGPNEVGYTSIGVASPHAFNDPGTVHRINVQAYSIYDPDESFNNTVTVITRGIYISEMITIYSAAFLTLVFIVVAFLFYRRKRFLEKKCKKPEKPWNISNEKKYLENLKKQDKKAHNEALKMMEDEYRSALLWYKDYRKDILKKTIEKNNLSKRNKNLIDRALPSSKKTEKSKKPIKKQKAKKKKSRFSTEFFKKSEKKPPKKEKKQVKKKQKTEEDQHRKEKLLLKIKREQEKQRRKIKK